MKPRFQARTLKHLADLAKDAPGALEVLVAELSRLEAMLYPFDAVNDCIKEALQEYRAQQAFTEGCLTKEDFASELARSLSNILYIGGSSSHGPTEVAAAALAAVEEGFPEQTEKLRPFLEKVLGLKTLLLSYKSTVLREDNENIVVGTKLIVDVRPVFSQLDPEQGDGHILVVRLKVSYRNGSDIETRVFTLDREGLNEMSDAVQRTILKISALKKSMANNPLGPLVEDKR